MSNKKPIGIVVDEAADLPQELIDKYQIGIVPLKADWPEVMSLPGENTFQKMEEAERRGVKTFAKTSQPSVQDFLDVFKKHLESFERLICLTITSVHSGTYNSGVQAKRFMGEEGNKVFVVDSLSASCGLGLIVLKAVDLTKEGKEVEEILKELEDFIPKVTFRAFLEDVKWLEASGRLSSTLANWMRGMQKLGIRPMIGLKKGKITAVAIKTGVKDVPTTLFKDFEAKTKKLRGQGKKIRVAITHGDDIDKAKRLKEMIEKNLDNVEVVFISLIDDILGVLTGPGALVLGWVVID